MRSGFARADASILDRDLHGKRCASNLGLNLGLGGAVRGDRHSPIEGHFAVLLDGLCDDVIVDDRDIDRVVVGIALKRLILAVGLDLVRRHTTRTLVLAVDQQRGLRRPGMTGPLRIRSPRSVECALRRAKHRKQQQSGPQWRCFTTLFHTLQTDLASDSRHRAARTTPPPPPRRDYTPPLRNARILSISASSAARNLELRGAWPSV